MTPDLGLIGVILAQDKPQHALDGKMSKACHTFSVAREMLFSHAGAEGDMPVRKMSAMKIYLILLLLTALMLVATRTIAT